MFHNTGKHRSNTGEKLLYLVQILIKHEPLKSTQHLYIPLQSYPEELK